MRDFYDFRIDLDDMTYQDRLFILSLVAGHLAQEDLERTINAAHNLSCQLLGLKQGVLQ